ncbi:MAG: Gfo/Idh/MocA family oxidoreductase, partial [Faecalibacterium sp.]|nr:Gfo/Idh/MocA family oxidoreductase [Faecalibacterium sp.]
QEHNIFVAEAIWPRYMPSRSIIQSVLDSGIIGKINTLTANLCYPVSKKERLVNPELAGGALLDVGIYGINFALMHFGTEIDRIDSSVQFTPSGVDGMESITMRYKDGRMAILTHGIYSRSDRKGIFYGEKGYIIVENINNPQSISVFDTNDQLLQSYTFPDQISGYEYEFSECIRAIQNRKTESTSMPLEHTIQMMELFDGVRKQWGLVYPQEKN